MKSHYKNLFIFVISYFIISALWILFSDRAVHLLVHDEALNLAVQTYKGWAFVLITSVIMFIVLQKRDRKILGSKEELRSVFDAINDAIFVHDAQTGKILDVNRRMIEQFGYTREEVLYGTEYINAQRESPFTKDNAISLLHKSVIEGPQLFEWRCKRKDGTFFWAEINLRHTIINGNNCVLATVRDISKRKEAQEALSRMQRLESLGVLAGGIAHDFNNLLSGLFGFIEAAQASLVESPKAAVECLGRAMDVFDRAKGLAGQLLTFAKGGEPQKALVNLGELIHKTIQFALSGSKVTSSISIATDLWPCLVDKTQFCQVLDNIIINSRQAMPSGGQISVDAQNVINPGLPQVNSSERNFIRIVISDHGIGISPDNLKRVFDPFFTTKKQGSGLGLSTAFSIVSRHGGAIDIQSVLGQGTTVSIFLPASPQITVISEKKDISTKTYGNKRILVLDDEEIILEVCRKLLGKAGYELAMAHSGDEALEIVEGAPHFDIAILDLTIPGGKGGKEIVQSLRNIDSLIKIVASSGYSNDPVMADPTKFGFDAKLNKPYTSEELFRVLDRL